MNNYELYRVINRIVSDLPANAFQGVETSAVEANINFSKSKILELKSHLRTLEETIENPDPNRKFKSPVELAFVCIDEALDALEWAYEEATELGYAVAELNNQTVIAAADGLLSLERESAVAMALDASEEARS